VAACRRTWPGAKRPPTAKALTTHGGERFDAPSNGRCSILPSITITSDPENLDPRRSGQGGAVAISGDFTGRPQACSERKTSDQAEIVTLSLERTGAPLSSRKLAVPKP